MSVTSESTGTFKVLFAIVKWDDELDIPTVEFEWVTAKTLPDRYCDNVHVHYIGETSSDVSNNETCAKVISNNHGRVISAIRDRLEDKELAKKLAHTTGLTTYIRDFLAAKADLVWELISDLLMTLYCNRNGFPSDGLFTYERDTDVHQVWALIVKYRHLVAMRDNVNEHFDLKDLKREWEVTE